MGNLCETMCLPHCGNGAFKVGQNEDTLPGHACCVCRGLQAPRQVCSGPEAPKWVIEDTKKKKKEEPDNAFGVGSATQYDSLIWHLDTGFQLIITCD